MLLKVGELARSSGLTVRTLHHYDEIGLLKPSGRSEAGYRLYNREDVARLHGIQALRHLGLALGDIGALLDGEQASPALIIEQQMNALDREIAQASELRDRLALIREGILDGGTPDTGDWLQALSLMATYGKYFSAAELKAIFAGYQKIAQKWPALLIEVRALMDTGARPDSPETQPLARRWAALVHYWMDGDFALMHRWGDMYRREPQAHGQKGGPPTDMLSFMQEAIELRMALMSEFFDEADLGRIRYVPEEEWQALDEAGAALLRQGVAPGSAESKALTRRWLALVDRFSGGDVAIRGKLFEMHRRGHPLLLAGAPLSHEVRTHLHETLKTLDPHAT
jgi:DNA-binding transcriptional MerR regulator